MGICIGGVGHRLRVWLFASAVFARLNDQLLHHSCCTYVCVAFSFFLMSKSRASLDCMPAKASLNHVGTPALRLCS
jgi:hypothetical protein